MATDVVQIPQSPLEVILSAPGDLPGIILQQLAILLPHRDKELINGHRSVDSDLPSKQRVDFVFLVDGGEHRPWRTRARARELEYLNCRGRMFGNETGETFDTHVVVTVASVGALWVATGPFNGSVTDASVTVTQSKLLDHHLLEAFVDKVEMTPGTGVKRKRGEVESGKYSYKPPTTVWQTPTRPGGRAGSETHCSARNRARDCDEKADSGDLKSSDSLGSLSPRIAAK